MNADTPAAGISPWASVDTSKANISRVYDYWLGGKDNYAADRELAEKLMAIYPPMPQRARENRLFLARAVTFLAEQGIRQFLDIGAGLPTAQNTHQIAKAVDPACRVIYADNDPVVITHAHALLADEGVVAIQGDLTRPAAILRHPDVSPVLNPGEPLGLILAMVLHFCAAGLAGEIMAAFAGALAPGSYVVVSVGSGDEEVGGALTREYTAGTLYNHSPAQVAGFLTAFGVIEPPGLVDARDWEPKGTAGPGEHRGGRILAGVARKPQ